MTRSRDRSKAEKAARRETPERRDRSKRHGNHEEDSRKTQERISTMLSICQETRDYQMADCDVIIAMLAVNISDAKIIKQRHGTEECFRYGLIMGQRQ
jgi:hypothetical protein